MNSAEKIIASRAALCSQAPQPDQNTEEEGGCGVTGFISSIPVTGKNIFEPSVQMHNRGNGKGGGIAAVGFIPEALGVSRQVLEDDYMLHIALLDESITDELVATFILPHFTIDKSEHLPCIADFRSIGLEVKPPEIMRYFVRVKQDVLDCFIRDNKLESLDRRDAEDEGHDIIHEIETKDAIDDALQKKLTAFITAFKENFIEGKFDGESTDSPEKEAVSG